MNDSPLTSLRRLGPAGLDPARHAALRASLLDEARTAPATHRNGPRAAPIALDARPRRWRHRTAAVLAGAIVLGGASAAAAHLADRSPAARDVQVIEDRSRPVAAAHGPGWRPELDAERVGCDAPGDAADFESYASDAELAAPLEEVDLLDACLRTGTELGVVAGDDGRGEVCAERGGALVLPVAALGAGACDGIGLTPLTAADLTALNAARAEEASIRALDADCATRAEAEAWVRSRLAVATAEPTLRLLGTEGGPSPSTTTAAGAPDGPTCFGPYVDWRAGTVLVDATSQPR